MPRAQTPEDRSHTDITLVKKYVNDKFTLEAAEAEHIALVREAVEKKSIAAVLEAQLKAAETAAEDKKQKAKDDLNKELARLKKQRDEGILTLEEYQSRRMQAEDDYKNACDKAEKSLAKKRKSLNDQLTAQRKQDEILIQSIAAKYAEKQYEKLSVYQRAELQSKKANIAAEEKERAKAEEAALADTLSRLEAERNTGKKTKAELKAYDEQIAEVKKQQAEAAETVKAAEGAETEAKKESAQLEKVILDAKIKQMNASNVKAKDLLDEVSSAIDKKKEEISDLHVQIEANEQLGIKSPELEARLAELTAEVGATDIGGSLENLRASLEETAHKEKVSEIKNKSAKDGATEIRRDREVERAENDAKAAAQWEYFKSEDGMKDEGGKALANAVGNLANKLNDSLKQIDSNINSFYEYQASVEARLQGSDESFQKSLKNISKNVGMSGLVKQKEVIDNLKKLSDAGIAYNLDLRAFLATISEDIANTFDVFDSNLLRLIRLQQSDTTVARLGMEASLTRLFNEFFSDTSYLTDAADSVSQALIDANSQLTKDMSVEFEFMVQKWLGALYSLGMDSSTVSTIAQGLNYLGTGNVEALNSNDALQSLLAMSASRAGISYADILTGGLDADTTNNLMKSMIEYLKSIAENTDNNQVTKSAYSNVFGFSISDLTAVSSLSTQDISNIYKQSLSYQEAMDEYEYQANQILARTHISQMMQTVFDNALASASTAIGNNAATYGTWMVLNTIEDLTGGIAIPAISVMGNMVDLHQTVTGLAKTGIAGLGLMGSLLGSLFNGSLFGTTDYNKWGYDEFTSRGSATKGISKGTASGVSESSSMSMVGSSSSSDIKSTSMSDATDSAEEDSKVTNKNVEDNADIYEKIYAAIASENTSVLQEVITLNSLASEYWAVTNDLLREDRRFKTEMSGMDTMLTLLDPSRVFLSSIVSMLPFTNSDFIYDSESKMLSVTENAMVRAATSVYYPAIQEIVDDVNTLSTTLTNYFGGSSASYGVQTTSGGASSTVARMESTSSQSNISTIANLTAQTSVGISGSSDSTTNQLITNDGLKVSINQMSPEVSAYIAATVKSMFASAITGNSSDVDTSNDVVPLIDLLSNLLRTQELNVKVTNDNFDTALQKSAFSY